MVLCISSRLKASKTGQSIRSITLQAMLLAVLVTQEYILQGIPQIGLTAILIIVYARFLPYKQLIPLLIAYSFLDNLLGGSLNVMYLPTHMLIWTGFGSLMRAIRNAEDYVVLLVATIATFFMGFLYIPVNAIVFHYNTWEMVRTYIYYDIPFDIALAANTVVTFLLLYQTLTELLRYLFERIYNHEQLQSQL